MNKEPKINYAKAAYEEAKKSRQILYKILLFIIFVVIILAVVVRAPSTDGWVLNNDSVYINDSKAYISVSPHTIHSSQWIYFNISAKSYTGDVDIAFGFNTTEVKPTRAELYNPHVVQLPNITTSKTFINVTSISVSTSAPEYGNIYNTYRRKINYSPPIGYDNLTNSTIWGNITTVVAFDSCVNETSGSCVPFIPNKNYTITWNTTQQQNITWQNIANRFNSISFNYDNFSTWYVANNLSIVGGNYYTLRIWMELPISLTPITGKFGFAIKPSFQTLQQASSAGNLYYLDPWYNSSWTKRKFILVNNTGNATILTNFTVNLTIPYDSDMNTNFSDIRIVNTTSGLTVPYWNETVVASSYAIIFFNASVIPASTWDNTTYYLYYGNPSATMGSDGTSTFPFFDDFSGDLSKWTVTGANSVVSNGEMRILGENTWQTNGAVSKVSVPKPFVLEYKHRAGGTGISSYVGLTGGGLIIVGDPSTGLVNYFGGTTTYNVYKDASAEYTGTYAAATNYKTKLINRDDGYDSYRDDGLLVSGASVNYNFVSISQYGNTEYAYIDNVRVRKYVPIEPTAELGVEQSQPFTPPVPINIVNTTYNFGLNRTWEAGSGNVTDGFNVSRNGTWYNGTATFLNTTTTAHGWINDTLCAFNTSGGGTLGSCLTLENRIPNNVPLIGSTSISASEIYKTTGILTVTTNVTDSDSDTLTVTMTMNTNGVDVNYTMNQTLNTSTWTYDYSSSVVDAYTVNRIYASDTYAGNSVEIVSLTFNIITPPGGSTGGGGGGGGGSSPSPSTPVPTSSVNLSLIGVTEGARSISDVEEINKCLTDSFLLKGQCTNAVSIALKNQTNWYTILGAYLASIFTIFGLNLMVKKKRSYFDALIYGTITVIFTLAMNLVGFNFTFIWNYLMDSSLSAWTFFSFATWSFVGTVVMDEWVFKKPRIWTVRKFDI